MADTQAPSKEMLCPNCGKDEVGTYTADDSFPYGLGTPITLIAKDVEFFRCMACELVYTGEDGEKKRHQAVQEHLAALRRQQGSVIDGLESLLQRESSAQVHILPDGSVQPTQPSHEPPAVVPEFGGIDLALNWLLAALQCGEFRWDADQKEAAQESFDMARAELNRLKAETRAAQPPRAEWQPIETAPKGRDVFFWIEPNEGFLDTSGNAIVAHDAPRLFYGRHGRWSSLHKAVLWHDGPTPPTKAGE